MTRLAIVAVLATSCAPAPDLPLARGPERSTTTTPVATTAPPTPTTTHPSTTTTAPAEPEVVTTSDMPPVLVAIAECESGQDYRAENPTSTASGRHQFLDSTWATLDAGQGYLSASDAPPHIQDAAAVELYERSGTQPWAASRACWS